jgi:hypothetical protein
MTTVDDKAILLEVVSDEVRELIESEWPESVPKLPPKKPQVDTHPFSAGIQAGSPYPLLAVRAARD